MKYQNPKLPDEVNVSQQAGLKAFLKLLLMAATLAAMIILLLNISAHYFAKKIPFRFETAMMERFGSDEEKSDDNKTSISQLYLQDLADKLLAQSGADEEFKITVHYSDEDTLNAYATLGGQVFFFKGLVRKLKSETALAMVMAHEIAHIVNRDPITSLSRGLTTAIALSAIFGSSDNTLIRQFVGSGEQLTALKYSRDHELNADADGYQWVQALYGHTCGAEELFELFENLNDDGENLPEMLATHPYASKRLFAIKAKQGGYCKDNDIAIPENQLY